MTPRSATHTWAKAMLKLKSIHAGYGNSKVLFGIDLNVNNGEVVTLLGRNGMGKTTTIRTICGLLKSSSGEIEFIGNDLTGLASYRIARAGIGLVPEGRQIFPNLSVRENLVATASNRHNNDPFWHLQNILELFPSLHPRLSNLGQHLSGGEQQMLAIGRALMTNPRLLILDEATEGLAPLIRTEIWTCLRSLKNAGQSILVIDKNLDALLEIADRHYIMEKGRIVWAGDSHALESNRDIQDEFLGV